MNKLRKLLSSIGNSIINFHVHSYQRTNERKEQMVGTNRYIDGKEIMKKQYGYESRCRCGKYYWYTEWRDVK